MRKRIFFIRIKYVLVWIALSLLWCCDSENALDCFQTSGAIVARELDLGPFDRILVNRDITLQIKEAPEYKVVIQTGENLINDVHAQIIGDRLVLTDDNTCNLVRDFGITKITVEAPNISEIKSSTQYEIESVGTLNFLELTLISEDFNEPSEFTVGDFRMSLNAESVTVISNNISFFYLEGAVENLSVNFFSGSGRFEGMSLTAQNVDVFHRGSNDMVVNPQQSLIGELYGTGNLISVAVPPIIEVDQFYTGQLIFN